MYTKTYRIRCSPWTDMYAGPIESRGGLRQYCAACLMIMSLRAQMNDKNIWENRNFPARETPKQTPPSQTTKKTTPRQFHPGRKRLLRGK